MNLYRITDGKGANTNCHIVRACDAHYAFEALNKHLDGEAQNRWYDKDTINVQMIPPDEMVNIYIPGMGRDLAFSADDWNHLFQLTSCGSTYIAKEADKKGD